MVKKASILSSYCSDHSCISLDLSPLETHEKGNGFWKFNNTLTKDTDYVNSMKGLLVKWSIDYNHIIDKRIKWDLIHMQI